MENWKPDIDINTINDFHDRQKDHSGSSLKIIANKESQRNYEQQNLSVLEFCLD